MHMLLFVLSPEPKKYKKPSVVHRRAKLKMVDVNSRVFYLILEN